VALRQREDEDEDRARTWPQPDGDNRRESVAPAARPGQLLRLRSVRVAPGQCAPLVVMVVGVRKRVIVPMMRVLCRSVIVVAAMGAGVRIVHVVDMTGRRHRRRFGFLKRITPTAIANSCQQRYPTRVINFIQTRILITHHSRRAGCRNSTKGGLCSACARWRLIEVAHDIG
jgi:hypothetical protein